MSKHGSNKRAAIKSQKPTPGVFFKNIGIRLLGNGNGDSAAAYPAIRDLKNANLLKAYEEITNQTGDITSALYDFFHSNLQLVKILYGTDFHRIRAIAEGLQKVQIPSGSKILDVGGGAGHLAFWMADIWKDSIITVADKYLSLGTEWAKQLQANRVTFVNATLPDLTPLQGQQFNFVVLSRVLTFILQNELPSYMNSFTLEEYFNSPEAKGRILELEELLEGVPKVLAPDGSVIVVESWSPTRILLIAKAFEQKGLLLNIDLFSPYDLGIEYSIMAFSRHGSKAPIHDIPLAIAAVFGFGRDGKNFSGLSAEFMRTLFATNPPVAALEFFSDEKGKVRIEIFEQCGLMLYFKTFSTGHREATLLPALEIPSFVDMLKGYEIGINREKKDKIIQKLYPA